MHATTRLYPHPDPGGPRDGELSEADIAINGAEFWWSLDGTEPGTLSLTTLLLHELGHALGLAHSCQMGLAEHGASGLPDCVSIHPQTPLMHPAALERLGSSRTAPSKAEAASALPPAVDVTAGGAGGAERGQRLGGDFIARADRRPGCPRWRCRAMSSAGSR